jgi:hypothetical protein
MPLLASHHTRIVQNAAAPFPSTTTQLKQSAATRPIKTQADV